MRCGRAGSILPVVFVGLLFAATGGVSRAGSLPQPGWNGGGVSWESGYLLSYGTSTPSPALTDPNLRRVAATKAAVREALRNLYRLLLGVRVQESLTVRDYLRQDPELQKAVREELRRLPPWQLRIGPEGTVEAAFRLPLGGRGGVSDLVADLDGREYREASSGGSIQQTPLDTFDSGSITGVVLIDTGGQVVPALRPRIMGSGGSLLLAFGDGTGGALERAAYVSYHHSLEEALADPVVGENPLVGAVPTGLPRGTDLVLPPVIEEVLAGNESGRLILSEARIAVVLP